MTTHKINQTVVAVAVLVLVAAMIFVPGCSGAFFNQSVTEGSTDANSVAPQPAAPPPAKSSAKAPPSTTFSKTWRTITDKTIYFRILSWWGVGGPEAAMHHQGIGVGKHGEILVGANKGTGILESFWSWLKSTLWTIAIGTGGIAIVLSVLSVIPQTSAIGTTGLRWLASLGGPLGSVVEWLRGKMVWKKPLTEVVNGGENFKDRVSALPSRLASETGEGFTDYQKAVIIKAFQDAHGDAQTGNTPAIVKSITG